MIQKSTLPLFHFLFCQLIEQCYNNHKEQGYYEQLKRVGIDTGYRLYNQISIKKQINDRPNSITAIAKNIQTKVFKYLFNYEAASVYSASQNRNKNQQAQKMEGEQTSEKIYYQVIVDNISIYLTWMPEHMWDVSIFVAGVIQAICRCSGLNCEVTSATKNQNPNSQYLETQYFITISEDENKRWNQKQ